MQHGTIIFLNGTSSSGKTPIAKTLQEIMEGYYIRTGSDHVLEAAPDTIHAMSDGHHPPQKVFCGCFHTVISKCQRYGSDQPR